MGGGSCGVRAKGAIDLKATLSHPNQPQGSKPEQQQAAGSGSPSRRPQQQKQQQHEEEPDPVLEHLLRASRGRHVRAHFFANPREQYASVKDVRVLVRTRELWCACG